MDDLTDRQAQILVFINGFRARNQCNPTCAEIAQHFGFASANASNDHLRALIKKSVLRPRLASGRRKQQKSRGYIVESPWDEYSS